MAPPAPPLPPGGALLGPQGWYPAGPPRAADGRRRWLLPLAMVVAVAGIGLGVLAAGRSVIHLGSPTVALAAPAAIAGMPKTQDFTTQPVTVLGQHLLDVVSAEYGDGAVRYAVVAVSGVQGTAGAHAIMQAVAPQAIGDDSLDTGPQVHVSRSGIDFTCSTMHGAVPGAVCGWSAGGVTGDVIQVGSDDVDRCADFADRARLAVVAG